MAKASFSHFEKYDDLLADGITIDANPYTVEISTGEKLSLAPRFNATFDYHNLGIIKFDIQTIDESGEKHPYFREHRASELAARAIRHFELTEEVLGIKFSWQPAIPPLVQSDNYERYVEARNLLRPSMSLEEARQEAVYATWTMQKIAIPNGFRKVAPVVERDGTPDTPGDVSGTIWKK